MRALRRRGPPARTCIRAARREVVGRRSASSAASASLHPDVRDALALEIAGDIVVVELDLAAIERDVGRAASLYRPIPRLPASARDLALVVRDDVAAGEVESAVRHAAGPLAEEVRLFDRFTGGAIPAGPHEPRFPRRLPRAPTGR